MSAEEIEKVTLDFVLDNLSLEKDYVIAWKYKNKFIVGYNDKCILIVKPDGVNQLHWNLKFPVIEEVNGLQLIYLKEIE